MRPDLRQLTAVFDGGAVGTALRALLAEAVAHDPGAWPWATLAANLLAAGLLAHLTARPPRRWWLLGPGLCGGLSTFSTVQIELLWMLDAGHVALAALYTAVSVAAGLAVVAAVRGRSAPA